jgi:hypothetical protein
MTNPGPELLPWHNMSALPDPASFPKVGTTLASPINGCVSRAIIIGVHEIAVGNFLT